MKTKNYHSSRRDFLKKSSLTLAATPFLSFTSKDNTAKNNQICIFSKHLHWLDFMEVGEIARQIGFSGVDLTVRKGGHVSPENVEEQLPKAVADINKAGIDVPMMATNIKDVDDPLTEKILKIASKCGIRYYRTDWNHYDPKLEIIENLNIFKKKTADLAKLNAKYNIHGGFQNHSGNYVGASIWDLWYQLKDLDPRYAGCNFDPRHATVEGGMSWPVDMKLIKKFIKGTIVKDFVWEKKDNKWRPKNVPLGEGMVDFEKFFSLYKQFGLSGPISLHIEYPMFPGPEDEFSAKEKNEMAGKVIKRDFNKLKQYLTKAGIKYS